MFFLSTRIIPSSAAGQSRAAPSLANNGRQIENPLTQIAIAVNFELRTSRTTIDTFGEKTPRKFLRHDHSGSEGTGGPRYEIPGFCSSLQKPLSAASDGNL